MTCCPHCFVDSATLRWQAERIEELEQRLERVKRRARVSAERAPRLLAEGLTLSENNVLHLLLTIEIVAKERLFRAINHSHGSDDLRMVNVIVSKLRKKIRPLGLEIRCTYGVGYWIPREQKTALTNFQPLAVNQNEWALEQPATSAAAR